VLVQILAGYIFCGDCVDFRLCGWGCALTPKTCQPWRRETADRSSRRPATREPSQSSHLYVLTRAKLPAYKSHAMRYISFALRGDRCIAFLWLMTLRRGEMKPAKSWRPSQICRSSLRQETAKKQFSSRLILNLTWWLLDIGLPKLNGLAAAARIFKASPGTRVLFLSHNNDPEIIYAARSVGASGFVCKPKVASDLLRAIAAAIGAQRGKGFTPALYASFQRTRVKVRPGSELRATSRSRSASGTLNSANPQSIQTKS
jgi:CheY-like chemotaxis protein